jgi:hypothetical protein
MRAQYDELDRLLRIPVRGEILESPDLLAVRHTIEQALSDLTDGSLRLAVSLMRPRRVLPDNSAD